MILRVTEQFHAAHHLPAYAGRCHNMHGHTYRVEIELQGEVDPDTGMMLDFSTIKAALRDCGFEHVCLNDLMENPTAETMAVWLAKWLLAYPSVDFSGLQTVTIWETDNAAAVATRGRDF